MAGYGMLGQLPPGLRGLLAAEQMGQQRSQNELGQLGGILSLQGMMEQRQQAAQQQQALQSLIPQLNDPAARMLAQAGDIRGAIGRQFPQQQKQTVVGPGATVLGSDNKPIFTAPFKPAEQAESSLAKLNREMNALPPNDPQRRTYQDAITKMTTRDPGVRVTTNVLPPQKTFENEDKLRADYTANPLVKSANEMQNAFNLIEAAYQRPSAANDLAMATKYMKILDPTSVVRESEFALAVNATGLLDKVQNYAASVLEGKKLNPNQRKDFYDSAKAINDSFQKQRGDVDSQYSEMATGYGLEPKNVIPSLRKKPNEMTAQPQGDRRQQSRRVVDY